MVASRRLLVVSTGRDRCVLAAARSLHRSGWIVGVGAPVAPGMLGAYRDQLPAHVGHPDVPSRRQRWTRSTSASALTGSA